MFSNFICHSGGCPGSDMEWEIQGREYGIKTIAYSFKGHTQYGEFPQILTENELIESYGNVIIAEKGIKRPLQYITYNPYVKNLLSRNWFQVKNSESIYAIGIFFNKSQTIVKGGTGWAVQMAIDNKKPIYLFEQNLDHWFVYYYPENKFTEIYVIPELTSNFAGIGTREITDKGKQAIKEIYKVNLEQYGK